MVTNAHNSINNSSGGGGIDDDVVRLDVDDDKSDLVTPSTVVDDGGSYRRSNISTFQRYMDFHCKMAMEQSIFSGKGNVGMVDLLFWKELQEMDLTILPQDNVTNCILYIQLEVPPHDRFPTRGNDSLCRRWKQYVRAALSGQVPSSESSPATNIRRPTMGDGVDAECVTAAITTCRKYPLYTAIRLGYTWSPVLQDLVQADPTVLESLDWHEVLPPFALAATIDKHEQILHPPPTMTNTMFQQLQPRRRVTIPDANGTTTALETDTTTTHHNNNTKDATTCLMCGGHLFHLDSSISKNGDANVDSSRKSSSTANTPFMESDRSGVKMVDGSISCVRDNDDDDDEDDSGGSHHRDWWHRRRRRERQCKEKRPESENVRWLDTIYHLLRADPTILDKITEMGRAELATLSLKERQER